MSASSIPENAVAVTGMAGRWPGANSPDALWEILVSGRETVSHFREDELEWSADGDEARRKGLSTVRARGVIENADQFAAEFFGIYPREAELMDPQHRLFLESAWEALDDAATDPIRYPGLVGVFAGASMNTYLLSQLCRGNDFATEFAGSYQVGNYQAMLGNDKDFLPTRLSYKLNLRGPSIAVQTACSTSLVAIHLACQNLLTFQCDMALAGGASITFPQKRDYLHEAGGMVSADGHCRAFDAGANGTVFGHGVGVVVLKRLEDALADGDPIHAVILGSAVNNDGNEKIGFAAPSIRAQAEVVSMALAAAGISPGTVSCIEAHGTGTLLGDPIEVEALTRAFRASTDRCGFCAIGTGKTHIGHLDVAAGVTGLIKLCLQLRHERIPALLHFSHPNPGIDFDASPFFPVAREHKWPRGESPRRAGVSAFGVGGTNAHVIVEEAPARESQQASGHPLVLPISAKSPEALASAAANLASHLDRHHDALALPSVARTLQLGRSEFPYRFAVTAATMEEAARQCREIPRIDEPTGDEPPAVTFLFPGQGAQRPGMGSAFARRFPVYRAELERVLAAFDAPLAEELAPLLDDPGADAGALTPTRLAQPALFATGMALAALFRAFGVAPSIVIGHSVGEFAAACLAGIVSLEDAARLVAERGRLMQEAPHGAMLAVQAAEDEILARLPEALALAAVNAPRQCVVSGPVDAIEEFERSIQGSQTGCTRLQTSHAFHSDMMDAAARAFRDFVATIPLHPPAESPAVISTATGRPLDTGDATSSDYWASQLRHPVRFADAMTSLFSEHPATLLVEVGPGRTLSALAAGHPERTASHRPLPAPLHAESRHSTGTFAECLAALWSHGLTVEWSADPEIAGATGTHLPTYPFERKRYWATPGAASGRSLPEHVESAPPGDSDASATTTPSLPEEEQAGTEDTPRKPLIASRLRNILLELSGMRLQPADDSRKFVELGFDSLFLTQARQSVQSEFGVKVTFRQLLGELPSIDALAAHIDAALPGEVPGNGGTGTSGSPGGGKTAASVATTGPMAQEATEPPPAPSRHGPFRPATAEPEEELAPAARAALDNLVERYNAKTRRSKTFAATHRPHFCDPRAASNFRQLWKEMVYPIVCARSKGSHIVDLDGNDYIDVTLGFGVHFLGHSPDFVVEAVQRQMEAGFEIGPQSPLAGEAACMLCQLTGMERATFCNTGSEAVMAAMRVARTATGRDKVVYFNGDYHGMFDSVLARGFDVQGERRSAPIAPGIPRSQTEDMVVLDYDDPGALEFIASHADEIAAVIVEPVQARHPDLQPREFLHHLRQATRHNGILLVFDEVITGFRCCPGGAQEWFGIEADLATYGKIVGGGIPIGVLAGRSRYMDVLDGGQWAYGDLSVPEVGVTFFAGTFVRHPLAMAAAHAVLKFLMECGPSLQERTNALAERMVGEINGFLDSRRCGICLESFASLFHLEFDPSLSHAGLLYYYLRDKGIHIWEGRVGFLSIAHTDNDVDRVVEAFKESVREMQHAGFLPDNITPIPRWNPGESPLTEAQREIFYSAAFGDDANCAYNESNVLEFSGVMNGMAMRKALAFLVDRHPALRSRFSPDGQSQHFPDNVEIPLEETDLTSRPPAKAERILNTACATESSTPFDLARGPLLRLRLFHLPGSRHALLFTAHHLVCDGWSFGMLVDELSKSYNAFRRGTTPKLPPAMPFEQFAKRQIEPACLARSKRALDFWKGKFSPLPPDLALPTDHPYPEVKSYAGAMVSREMDADVFRRLSEANPRLGGTMFATLFGVFAGFLHRICRQDDLVVGVPAAGQTMTGCDELVGHCLNFLPVRIAVDGKANCRILAANARDAILEAYEFQDFTYGTLVRSLDLPRNASRLPLVSVMFNIDRAGIDRLRFDALTHQVRTNPKQFVNLDLFFNLVQTDSGITVECEYNADLFERESAERLLAQFERMVAGCVDSPEATVDSIPLIDPAERRRILVEWNDTGDASPLAPVHEAVAQTASQSPNRTAVVCGGESLSYGTLIRRSRAIAASILESTNGAQARIGVCMPRTPDTAAALLAVMQAGAAYVPIDPDFPAQRIRWMVEDAGLETVLTAQGLPGGLLPDSVRTIDVTTIHEDAQPDTLPAVPLDATAYVLFTSGSTGRPKGVQIPHRALANFLESMRRRPGFSANDTLLAVTTLSFDISGLEWYLPLLAGGRLVVADRGMARDPGALIEAIGRHGVTVMQATPSTWRLMLEAGWPGSPGFKALCGGEAFPRDLANALLKRCGEVWNMYGPTETTIWSTCDRVSPKDSAVPIGRPIANTQVYVLDDQLEPVGSGQSGALYIAGDGLADGYLNQPELTTEKFIPNPFAGESRHARMYDTGDLARWLPDGRLECLGRRDQQIKIRGFRIELGEIETALNEHPDVSQSVATLDNSVPERPQLLAYVVERGQDHATTKAHWQGQWEMMFEAAMKEAGDDGDALSKIDAVIAGWASESGFEGDVREWIDTTLDRISSLGPRSILEIGCGTGQLLLALAPACERYVGCDFARPAVDKLTASTRHMPHVDILHAEADHLESVPDGTFDTVVVNSVLQYFPDAGYLRRVLAAAASRLSPGGRIYLGDIQSHSLLECHHTARQFENAAGHTTAGDLRRIVASRIENENELVADPTFFHALRHEPPFPAFVDIRLRRGSHVNETTAYHYDAILEFGEPSQPSTPVESPLDWCRDSLSVESLAARLDKLASGAHLAVTNIPDGRLISDLAILEAVRAASDDRPLATLPRPESPPRPTAESLFQLADSHGLAARVQWGEPGTLRAVFHHKDAPRPIWHEESDPPRPLNPKTINSPKQEAPRITDSQLPLRDFLAQKLPDYMLPARFLKVPDLPLTPNGKIDRNHLPTPPAERSTPKSNQATAPRNKTEQQLLAIWQDVLGTSHIGIHDNFFELGGDSILSFQITARANADNLPVTPRQFFQHPTIAGIAQALASNTRPNPQHSPIQRVSRDAYRRKKEE